MAVHNTYTNRDIDWLLEQLESEIFFGQKLGFVEFLKTFKLAYSTDILTLHVQTNHIHIQVQEANLANAQTNKPCPFRARLQIHRKR